MVETAAEAAWRPLFQQTIDDYYQGKLDEGREACERLLSLADLPPDIRQQARRNAIFYAPPLAEWVPGLRTLPLVTSVPAGWSTFNPSIAAAPDGFRMILRSSNYVVTPRLVYTANDPAGVIRTQNYLLTLDADLQVRDVAPINDRAVAPNREPPIFPVVGFEDCRLLLDGETWRVVGTSREWNPGGICQMALMRLDGAKLHDLRLLNDPAPGIHEKNWMPAVTLDGLRFIYSSRPTVLLRVDETSGATEETIWREAPEIAVDFHGGSQAIPVDGGWLCVIHEGVNFDDGGRVYPHRFLWFDADWNLSRCSRQFFWRERGIEFCAGLARDGDRLVASFGAWDREAYLAEMPLAEALALLRPFAPPAVAVEAPRLHVAAPSAPPAVEPEPVGDQPKPTIDGVTPFPASTRLAAVTLAGNNERLIRDALRSVVDWVDACIVLDTGSTDRTLKIARAVAGDKLVVQSFPWIDDFAAARNAALDAAAEWGADWAVILDTDERIELRGVDIRAALAGAEVDVASIAYADGSYAKERFFRMPARGRYFGPTHEAYFHNGRRGDLAGPIFTEEPKSAEGYRRKAERDVAILTRHTAANPDDPRWFYYLADSLETLGRREEAIAAWEQCWSLKGWDEEGAWAMYRAARCWLELKNHDRAIEACAAGMARHAGLAELPWLAAFACWQAGRYAQAVYWARMSAAMGRAFGAGDTVPRVGFRHQPALFEGPYDVLRFALRQLGDAAGADEAERLFQRALALREGGATEEDQAASVPTDDGAEPANPAVVASNLTVERILVVTPGVYEVQGRFSGDRQLLDTLRLLVPNGDNVALTDHLVWTPATDTASPAPGSAFGSRLELPADVEIPDEWAFRFTTEQGEAIALVGPPPEADPGVVLDALFEAIDATCIDASWERLPALHRRVEPVQRSLVDSAHLVRDVQFGDPPVCPKASVIIPLYRNFDFLDQQMQCFAADPEMRDVEIIYALDGPESADVLAARAQSLFEAHGMPFRLVVSSHNAGFARINNLAASVARGAYLALLNSDAWPLEAGWISRLVDFHQQTPSAGIIGPKLLYPDGRIQGAGFHFMKQASAPGWGWQSAVWGAPQDHPDAATSRPVEGVCGACMLMPRDLYESIGGFDERYVAGQLEDCDISLRVAILGLDNWYVADVAVVHAEAQSYVGAQRNQHWLYNAWLHNERWGDYLDACNVAKEATDYLQTLAALHTLVRPNLYLEIGVAQGQSLALARGAAIGIDPDPHLAIDVLGEKPSLKLYRMTSDEFFAARDRRMALGDGSLDLSFIDGLHLFEQVLNDVANVEAWSERDGVIVIHDVIPPTIESANRAFTPGWWVGDVWRIVPCLARHRPDLTTFLISPDEAYPSGLLIVIGLDPSNRTLIDHYDAIVAEGLSTEGDYQGATQAFCSSVTYTPFARVLAAIMTMRLGHPERERERALA